MATKIEWTERTWNPVTGCTKVSEACQNCYAEVMARRLQGNHIRGYENGFKVNLHHDRLCEPLSWKKPQMVFVVSMGDLFHQDVPFTFIDNIMQVIRQTPQHTYQLLTKRPYAMMNYFQTRHGAPMNCWLGTTCESSRHYDRIDDLIAVPGGSVKFLSCEPLLDNMQDINLQGIDWVITGGESGSRARRTDPDWFRSLRDACLRRDVPFFFKQWGAWGEDGVRRSKYANGSLLDDTEWKQYPRINNREDYRKQEGIVLHKEWTDNMPDVNEWKFQVLGGLRWSDWEK